MQKMFGLKGNIAFTAQPDHFTIVENAYLICCGGKVAGIYHTLPSKYRGIPIVDAGANFIIPGTCDLHVHASQYPFQGIGQNIENGQWDTWFERYAFPVESRFQDLNYAQVAYTAFSNALLKTPTTRICAYATTNADSTRLLMQALAERGFAGYVGKVNMDRNCDIGLLETTQETLSTTKAWLEQGPIGNIKPIITPRYFPSCTPEALIGLGKLAAEYHVPVQSHLSEGLDEILWVKKLDPSLAYYAQAYERAGLLGPIPRAIMAHCVFSPPEEIAKLRENHVIVAHCPQSNLNSSGQAAPIMDYIDAGIEVGLGTDVGGGNTLNMFRTIFEAILASKIYWSYHTNQSELYSKRRVLTLPSAFYLATKGGGILWQTGSFEPDYCFDAVIIDDSRFQTIGEATPYERLERIIAMSDDRDIVAKYIDGVCVYQRFGG